MKLNSHKLNFGLVQCLTFCLLACSHTILAQAPAQAPDSAPELKYPPLPKPINLKVLPRDTPPGDLIELMHGYTKQLGVECEYCHAPGAQPHRLNFADDSKPEKNTARTMITMTNEINARYLAKLKDADQKVTCATCHRGHPQPEVFSSRDAPNK